MNSEHTPLVNGEEYTSECGCFLGPDGNIIHFPTCSEQ